MSNTEIEGTIRVGDYLAEYLDQQIMSPGLWEKGIGLLDGHHAVRVTEKFAHPGQFHTDDAATLVQNDILVNSACRSCKA